MHNIEYYTYSEDIKRDYVQKKLNARVMAETVQEGGHGLEPIRWLDREPICNDYEDAQALIEKRDRKWYDQLAVRYYEPERGFSNKTLEGLKKKTVAAFEAYRAKDFVWAKTLKAEYVGCKQCGSKIKRDYIRTNFCPVCRADLRPETTLKAVAAAETKWHKMQAAEADYINAHAKRYVKWLVKIEYHT